MNLITDPLKELTAIAADAAMRAGALIAEASKKPIQVQTKTDGPSLASQVLTETDLASEKLILSHLEPTLSRFDLALLSEESVDDRSRFDKPAFWCIDPLDGTLPFTEGRPGYSVSIGLVARDGTPLIGVIYDPVTKTLYQATRGCGAQRNDQPLTVQSPAPDAPLSLITDSGFDKHPRFDELIAGLQQFGYPDLRVDFYGGAAMNAMKLLAQPPACYFKPPKPTNGGGSLWDYAASACIFQEAGASATDYFGNPLDLNRPDSTFMNHRGMIYATDRLLADKIMQLH